MQSFLENSKVIRIVLVITAVLIGVGYSLAESCAIKDQSYQGVVKEKVSKTRWGRWWRSSGVNRRYYLVVKTDAGDEKTVRVGRSQYSLFKEDDRVVKPKGERYPRREKPDSQTMTLEEFQKVGGQNAPPNAE